MRTGHVGAFLASLVAAFVVLSVFPDHRANQRVVTGIVAEVHAGEWFFVANEGTRLPVAVTRKTAFEGNASAIRPGSRVTVWYRGVGERRPVADRVRLLGDGSRH